MDELEDLVHRWLLKRCASSRERRTRASGLVQAAVDALAVDLVDVRSIFRTLKASGRLDYAPDLAGLPYTGFASVKASPVMETPSAAVWRQALETHGASSELLDALMPAHDLFMDWAEQDIAQLAGKLLALPEAAHLNPGSFRFSLSARQLLGSSKILDRLPDSARRALGVAHLQSTPRYVVVAGPSQPAAVLLIENTTTYEEAVRAGLCDNIALVAAYGYGLNMMSDSAAGWALVDSLTDGRCEVLTRVGHDHRIFDLLQHPHVYFWGDLDREGLRIALSLRKKLPQLRLSAMYQPMCEMVRDIGRSHPYSLCSAKANQQPWRNTGELLFDELAVSCAQRAVDQEAVDIYLHRHLGVHELTYVDAFIPRPEAGPQASI